MLRHSSLFERCVFRILFFGLLLFNPYLLLEFGCEEEEAMDSTYFISHGSPTLAIDEDLPARHFLMNWKKILPKKPQAILVISAHWDTRYPSVTTVERHNTIHDFYGFPQEMYKIKYDAVGAPELARTVKKCLLNGGFKNVTEDSSRGLDHGAWVPLHLMYPSADIPVCQLSVQSHLGPEYHFNLGRTLAPLKSQGILIIGSGSATHNLQTLAFHNPSPPRWAKDFDAWLTESLHNGRYDEIIEYKNKAPSATIAHPYPEHFYPLHVALGAAGEAAKAELIHTSWSLGTISYSSYAFKSA